MSEITASLLGRQCVKREKVKRPACSVVFFSSVRLVRDVRHHQMIAERLDMDQWRLGFA
jgi:hypothetical protein